MRVVLRPTRMRGWSVVQGLLGCRAGLWPRANLGAGLDCDPGLTRVPGWSVAQG